MVFHRVIEFLCS